MKHRSLFPVRTAWPGGLWRGGWVVRPKFKPTFLLKPLFLSFLSSHMKTLTKTIPLVILVVIAACGKKANDDSNGTPGNCVISRLSQQGDTAALSTYYSYNAQGLPTRIKAVNYEINFAYNGNKVIQTEGAHITTYTIGTDSLAQYAIVRDGSNVDSTVFLYNAEKYRIKSIHFFNGVKKDSIGYVIENGNVKSMTYYNEYGYVNYFRDFVYHTNLETKHWMYTKLNGDYGYFYYPWLGKPNKNLLKSSAQYGDLDSYNYSFDKNGKVEKMQVTVYGTPNISYTINVGHDCK
jgi:hypothetical protein